MLNIYYVFGFPAILLNAFRIVSLKWPVELLKSENKQTI